MRFTLLFVFIQLLSSFGFSYPNMIRHGYTSCGTCHVSPAGGGITTAYGRVLSKELLSRWSYEGEEQLLHGAANEKLVDWVNGSKERGFNVGGSFRYIQTEVETDTFKAGRSFSMQRDVEVAAQWDSLALITSYGIIYDPRAKDEVELRRIYLKWQINDNYLLRAGRFIPNFGIMFSDHYLAIKRNLQLSQFTERDAVESYFTFEKWSGSLSYSKAPESKTQLQQEEAFAGTINYNVSEPAKVGFNYWLGDYLGKKRDITGFNGILGLSKKLYSLVEVDYQTVAPDAAEKIKSLQYFNRWGYEITRGLHILAQLDGGQTDLNNPATKFYAFGGGITFYPRPHFEFQLLWTRPKYAAVNFADSGFLIFHYYL